MEKIPSPAMKSWPRKEILLTMTHKGTSDLQKLSREKRQKIREERREKSRALKRGMTTGVTEHGRNPPDSGHDWQEEGVDEEVSPMEEELWIEQWESLQLEIPQEVIPLSLTNPSTWIQAIVEEDLGIRAGEFGIWSWLDDELNDDNHLVIHWPEEVNRVTLQAYPSNRSIHLLYPTHEGAPPLPNTALENTENSDL